MDRRCWLPKTPAEMTATMFMSTFRANALPLFRVWLSIVRFASTRYWRTKSDAASAESDRPAMDRKRRRPRFFSSDARRATSKASGSEPMTLRTSAPSFARCTASKACAAARTSSSSSIVFLPKSAGSL